MGAVAETVILLHPPLALVGVSIAMERERQQNVSQWCGTWNGKRLSHGKATGFGAATLWKPTASTKGLGSAASRLRLTRARSAIRLPKSRAPNTAVHAVKYGRACGRVDDVNRRSRGLGPTHWRVPLPRREHDFVLGGGVAREMCVHLRLPSPPPALPPLSLPILPLSSPACLCTATAYPQDVCLPVGQVLCLHRACRAVGWVGRHRALIKSPAATRGD